MATDFDRIIWRLDYLILRVNRLVSMEGTEMAALDDINVAVDGLVADVTALKAGKDSAIGLLNGLAAKIDALIASGGDPTAILAKIADLSTNVKGATDELAAAVVADTR